MSIVGGGGYSAEGRGGEIQGREGRRGEGGRWWERGEMGTGGTLNSAVSSPPLLAGLTDRVPARTSINALILDTRLNTATDH